MLVHLLWLFSWWKLGVSVGAPVCPIFFFFFFKKSTSVKDTWLLCCCWWSCVLREAAGGGRRLESSFGRGDIAEFSPSHFSPQDCKKWWLAWPFCLDFVFWLVRTSLELVERMKEGCSLYYQRCRFKLTRSGVKAIVVINHFPSSAIIVGWLRFSQSQCDRRVFSGYCAPPPSPFPPPPSLLIKIDPCSNLLNRGGIKTKKKEVYYDYAFSATEFFFHRQLRFFSSNSNPYNKSGFLMTVEKPIPN